MRASRFRYTFKAEASHLCGAFSLSPPALTIAKGAPRAWNLSTKFDNPLTSAKLWLIFAADNMKHFFT